ncbi:MAG: hypothetical protein M1827_005094 [Pycnora praestabilis]|nr:MAG: hypothetical protein M1827_005094 [Pycnora praestabilis]
MLFTIFRAAQMLQRKMNAFSYTGSSFGMIALFLSFSTIIQALIVWIQTIRDAPHEIGSLLLQLGNTFARTFRVEACLVSHSFPFQSNTGPLSDEYTYSDRSVLENAIIDLADMLIQLSEEFLEHYEIPKPPECTACPVASPSSSFSDLGGHKQWRNPVLQNKLAEMRKHVCQRDIGSITLRRRLKWIFKRKHLRELARRLEYQQGIIASIEMTVLTEQVVAQKGLLTQVLKNTGCQSSDTTLADFQMAPRRCTDIKGQLPYTIQAV